MMYLIKKTNSTNFYVKDDFQISYNKKTGYARFATAIGGNTKRKKPDDMAEINFVNMLCAAELDTFKSVVLQNVIDKFMASRVDSMSPRTIEEDSILTACVAKLFKNVDFKTVTAKQVRNIIEEHDCSNDKKNRIKKKMQQLIDYAISEDMFPVSHNIFKSIKMWTVAKSEKMPKLFFEAAADVPPEHHTIRRLYNTAQHPHYRMLILMCTITGARINEVLQLTWDDVITKDKQNPVLRIRNSKIKPTDSHMDEYRYMDISLEHYQTMLEQRLAMQENEVDYGKTYAVNVHAQSARDCDRSESAKWKYIVAGADGYKPSYTSVRRWYADMWAATYDKYITHNEYPFPHERKPSGLTFHAFRRHYVCSFRDSIENFSLTNHEQLQQLIGHTVGSKVTDSIYTQWKASKVTDAKMNSKINLGVKF
jgi:integrase